MIDSGDLFCGSRYTLPGLDRPTAAHVGHARSQQEFEWESDEATAMACVPLQSLMSNGLLRVVVSTSAGDLPALLDTGAPVSIINTAAARLLRVGTYSHVCALRLSPSRRRTPFAYIQSIGSTSTSFAARIYVGPAGARVFPAQVKVSDHTRQTNSSRTGQAGVSRCSPAHAPDDSDSSTKQIQNTTAVTYTYSTN